jgi:pimeloyl-ACP methyl ester carboxylesterase
VLLHGGSGSWTHWLHNIGPLVDSGRWVLAPDLPGFGDSALPPAGKDADAMPAPLEQGLQTLVGAQACEVVGFSFGGMVAGLWGQAFGKRFSRLVLVGPPGLGRPAIEPIRPKAWRHLSDAAHRLRVHTHNLRELMLHHEASLTALACQLQQINAERDRLPHRRLSRTDVLARALQQLEAPVHLIYGEQDRYYLGQAAEIERVMRRCPGFVRMSAVPDAGHWVQFERPAAFHAALSKALSTGIGA